MGARALRGKGVEATFREARRTLRLVWLTEPSGRYRVVEPHMVFASSTGKRLLHFYQIGGWSAGSSLRGWKNPELSVSDGARVVEEAFTPRADYNPFNAEMFPRVVFTVSTRGGRVRVPDAE